jgi:HEAT repeat protein
VDPRNDHSFRIPRPNLTVAYGTPNACNSCHTDKDAQWSADILNKPGRLDLAAKPHWSELLASTNNLTATSMQTLVVLATDTQVPAIIRASAASRLRIGSSPASDELISKLASDPEPLVRWAAAQLLPNSDPLLTARHGPTLLRDPVRSVRLSAANALASIDPTMAAAVPYSELQSGFNEYIAAQNVSMERAESHINIANLQRMQGRYELAEQEYLVAITLNPSFVPGYVNLADLYRELGREQESEAILRQGLITLPNQPGLHHARGLALVRQQRMPEALTELQEAAQSIEAIPRYALVYAVALNSIGEHEESINVLEQAIQKFGDEPELLNAYTEFSRQP